MRYGQMPMAVLYSKWGIKATPLQMVTNGMPFSFNYIHIIVYTSQG